MKLSWVLATALIGVASASLLAQPPGNKVYLDPIDVHVPAITADTAVKWDYDIVYVRVPRKGENEHPVFAEVFHPAFMDPGGDLMLLHPDGKDEVLVAGGKGSVLDPYVSFDGEWVYYAQSTAPFQCSRNS